jgi:hypothetical protein
VELKASGVCVLSTVPASRCEMLFKISLILPIYPFNGCASYILRIEMMNSLSSAAHFAKKGIARKAEFRSN